MDAMSLYYDGVRAVRRAVKAACLPRPGGSLLDLGCDDGAFTVEVAQAAQVTQATGIEINEVAAGRARERGVLAVAADLGEPWPFADQSFDVVHANQVIEHMPHTDHFLREVGRVLKPDGYAVICTNNLASWHNVAALVLGRQPSPCHVSDEVQVGGLYAKGWENVTHAHLRVFTMPALVALAEHCGLEAQLTAGVAYYPLPGRAGALAARLDSRHAAFLLARFTAAAAAA